MGEKQLYSVAQLHRMDQEDLRAAAADWLVMTRLLLEPVEMMINGRKTAFDLSKLKDQIASVTTEEDLLVQISNNEAESSLHIWGETLLEKTLVTRKSYETWEAVFLDYLNERMKHKGLFAYIRDYDEYLYHNTSQIDKRRAFESAQESDALPKMKGVNGEVIVDCNRFPGFDVFHKGFCLTSCWRMFFGSAYKQLFPKQLLLEIQQVEKVRELGSGVFIELYKDPFQWKEPSNIRFQRLFRDQLGVAQLSYTNGVGLLAQPYIEFAFEDTVIQTVQYQNEQFQPTEKRNAAYFVTRTYDFLNDQYRVHRMKGALNVLAYFPWIDDDNEKMMNYHVIHPEMTIDQGIDAYEYYIRDVMDLDINDERFRKYTAILQFFIPGNALNEFPLEKLAARLNDVTIQQVKDRKDGFALSLEKGSNQLTVLFVDQKNIAMKNQLSALEV
ncbi:hypothetical protein NRIC_23850 [Enterococcus florum]|uniref:Uncharacterized protein n=1 Tax=Enterococcus florum TaxID=2480627 RepID=A0A4P5PD53_9ENTE|nr:hypothetical protein [Enterococcus florum]GCF94494.1 hypothetical protein NRIC_23850 [Enterococcus florum]